jgi:DNA-binding winged helix-turn-helix (wHTH) protein/TolB-like protein
MRGESAPAGRLHFAGFVFDRATGELYRDGTRVRLQDQPAQVLAALLERPGEVVTREDLRERLWKADTFVDFEHGLNTAVKKLRQALADAADTPRFIETLPRRGYRFIDRVELATPPAPTPPPVPAGEHQGPSAAPAPARRVTRPALWIPALAVAILLAGTGWRWQGRQGVHGREGPAATTQLAVMPLRVLASRYQDGAYLGVGMADAITTRLAGTRRVSVLPTAAVLPFVESDAAPVEVARSLGVRHLLVGTIQPGEQVYRVTVQLVRSDGVAAWGRTYDEPRAALLHLQDRLAEQVVEALQIELSPPDRARLHVRYTNNPDAYDRYLRGRSLLVDYTEAKMRSAIEQFEQALRLDPDYALARAGVATACAWFSVRYAHEADEAVWARRADEEARRALAQDGSLAEAHFAIASAAGTPYGGFDWKILLDRSAAALDLDPSLELAHLARMRAFYHLGLFEDAAREGREATRLNPAHSVEFDRLEVALLLFDGRFGTAVELAERLLTRTDAPAVHQYLGLGRFYLGDADSARTVLASIMRGDRPDLRAQASLASVEAASGQPGQARRRIAEILRRSSLDHHVAYSLGAAFAQLQEPAASLEWLERAADTGFPCYPWFKRDRLLDPIRNDPRFTRLLARVQVTHEEARRLQR